jgi:hypothetical protein
MILGEPIILGGGGGIACIVIITTDPSAVVTCSLGNTSISKTANADGKAVFELKKEGVWTITASLNGETFSKEIDTSLSLETEIHFSKPLAECTWEEISAVSKSGNASKWWSVGDTKTMTIDSHTYNLQIVDFDVYDVVSPSTYGRQKAGVVFHFKELYNATNDYSSRSSVFSTMQKKMACKDYLPTVKYSENDKSGNISEEQGNIFFPSEEEIVGANASFATAQVGTQFAFYAAGNTPIKNKVGTTTAASYWTRSSYRTTGYIVTIGKDGKSGYTANGTSQYYCPVFCL